MVKILPRIADNSENEWDYTASVISIQLGMRREGCGTPEEVRACSSDWERQRTEGSGPLAKETSSTSFQFFPENKTKQNHLKAVKEMTRAVCGLGKKKSPVVAQWLSHIRLFVTAWTAARQPSLSITISRSLLKLMSIQSVMPSSHPNLCRPILLLPSRGKWRAWPELSVAEGPGRCLRF